MKQLKIIMIFVLIGLLLSTFPVGSTRAQEEPITEVEDNALRTTGVPTFGMQIGSTSNLAVASTAGNHWVRYNGLLWSEVQPTEGLSVDYWQWNLDLDNYLIEANQQGMEVILVIRSTPAWAQKYDGWLCGPMGENFIDDFANFVDEVVKRYSQEEFGVNYYEIWNEPDAPYIRTPKNHVFGCWGDPDLPFFGGTYYGKVLEKVYPNVKANGGQLVLGGLLFPCDPEGALKDFVYEDDTWKYCTKSHFFEGVLQTPKGDDWPYFDVVNFHGYASFDASSSTNLNGIYLEKSNPFWSSLGGQVEGKLLFLKRIMQEYGIQDKPILHSEAGLTFRGDVTQYETYEEEFENEKADYLLWLYTRNIAKGIFSTIWYRLDGNNWTYNTLLDPNTGGKLPAFTTFEGLTLALSGATFQRELQPGSGLRGFEFIKDDKVTKIWVLFSEDGQPKTVRLTEGNQVYDHDFIFEKEVSLEQNYSFDRPIYILFEQTEPILATKVYLPIIIR